MTQLFSLRARGIAADMFAMVVFCFVTGMAIEVLISGLSFQQSLSSRLLAIPVNLLIAWPYGCYRDAWMRQAKHFSHPYAMQMADLCAFVTFQSPVYALILLSIGAAPSQVVMAVLINAVVCSLLGVAYGLFLDRCRRWFGASALHIEPLH
ncbi:L-alanine exporter AlaE [Vibrio stylophorae]|uniref:L-alanine exporter AlaE n=1 Tax=Vibrio stylophorae TaxID=659351 RepID=A0ABN8DSX7_9VIBR|nr:L-alanine exporter AlaE [Vibrio stylophorae]CAH0533010.1 L-alanine exporter AlaE [Vibrio stylophorae]